MLDDIIPVLFDDLLCSYRKNPSVRSLTFCGCDKILERIQRDKVLILIRLFQNFVQAFRGAVIRGYIWKTLGALRWLIAWLGAYRRSGEGRSRDRGFGSTVLAKTEHGTNDEDDDGDNVA